MKKPEKREWYCGRVPAQRKIDNKYNEGLEVGLAYGKAYHDSKIKGVVEVYEKYKTPDGSISNQAWMMHASDIMHDMWRVIKDIAEGENK